MKRNQPHIISAAVFHLLLIAMGFLPIRDRFELMSVVLLGGTVIYIVYWCIVNRKQFLSWLVFLTFLLGAVLQIILNYAEIIPTDTGLFSGLGQFFYTVYVVGAALLVGITNLILWLIDRHRRKKQAA